MRGLGDGMSLGSTAFSIFKIFDVGFCRNMPTTSSHPSPVLGKLLHQTERKRVLLHLSASDKLA